MSDSAGWDDSLDVPIIVSVTGHVDLLDSQVDDIRGRVENFLRDLQSRYTNTRLVLMSALAEGTDIVVSEVAMGMGIRIVPVIPKPIDDYRAGFIDRSYVGRFDAILSDPSTYRPFVLETESQCDRDSYRNLSAYLVFNSHVMIALWDGREYDRNGGTYDTMRMAYAGVDTAIRRKYQESVVRARSASSRIRHLDSPEDCLVYRIQVDRRASREELLRRGCRDVDSVEDGEGFIVPLMVECDVDLRSGQPELGPIQPEMPSTYDSMFRRIDTLNKDMGVVIVEGKVTYSADSVAARTRSDEGRNTAFDLLDTKDVSVSAYVEEIRKRRLMFAAAERYHVADSMALEYQRASFSRIHVMILVTVLTSLSFSLFILSGGSLIVNVVYTLLMIAGILMSRRHHRRKTYSKFIEYRALAESMRVEFYRGLLGSREPIPDVCYGYMKNELFWVRSVLKSWNANFMNDYQAVDRTDCLGSKAIDVVTSCWVDGQLGYHKKKMGRNAAAFGKYNNMTRILIAATTTISVLLILTMAILPDVLGHVIVVLEPVYAFGLCVVHGMDVTGSTVVRGVMILLVAVTSYYTMGSSLIHGGTPEQIGAKVQMFSIADIRMGGTDDVTTKREILWELGDQCLDEMNDWVFEHKAKDFKGGTMNVSPVDTDV